MNHSEVRVVFASVSHIPALLALAGACSDMKVIVSMDSWVDIEAKGAQPGVKSETVLKAWGADKGIKVMDISERAFHTPPLVVVVADASHSSRSTRNRSPSHSSSSCARDHRQYLLHLWNDWYVVALTLSVDESLIAL